MKIEKGIGGNNTNSVKELISNESLSVNTDRLVLCLYKFLYWTFMEFSILLY